MWLDRAIHDEIVARIQELQKLKCRTYDSRAIVEYNNEIDKLVNYLVKKYME